MRTAADLFVPSKPRCVNHLNVCELKQRFRAPLTTQIHSFFVGTIRRKRSRGAPFSWCAAWRGSCSPRSWEGSSVPAGSFLLSSATAAAAVRLPSPLSRRPLPQPLRVRRSSQRRKRSMPQRRQRHKLQAKPWQAVTHLHHSKNNSSRTLPRRRRMRTRLRLLPPPPPLSLRGPPPPCLPC